MQLFPFVTMSNYNSLESHRTASHPGGVLPFSIDHILNHAGPKSRSTMELCDNNTTSIASATENKLDISDTMRRFLTPSPPFDWLYYTRYHPPRLPRSHFRQQPAKRTPGRLPRVPFTPHQLNTLEDAYKQSMYLSSEEANQLAQKLDLSSMRVKIWFQNRRARDRREHRVDTGSGGTPKPHRFEVVEAQDLSMSGFVSHKPQFEYRSPSS